MDAAEWQAAFHERQAAILLARVRRSGNNFHEMISLVRDHERAAEMWRDPGTYRKQYKECLARVGQYRKWLVNDLNDRIAMADDLGWERKDVRKAEELIAINEAELKWLRTSYRSIK